MTLFYSDQSITILLACPLACHSFYSAYLEYLLISVTVAVLVGGLAGRLGDLHVLGDLGVLR